MERESKDVVQGAQPYLRSGRGTQNRQQASQSSRRYIPKGGFVIDFTTQALPKGKGTILPNGCQADVPREVLIARQQQAAARLSAPRHSATSSPASRNQQLPDLDFPDHPKPWGAPSCNVALKENVRPRLATTSSHAKQAGQREKILLPEQATVQVRAGASSQTGMREAAGSSCTGHHAGEMLDDDDIFDDDAPLLPDMHITKTPKIAHDPGVSYNRVLRNSCQAGTAGEPGHAPVTSMYVQQLLSQKTSAPESAVQKELLDLKAQITQAAAVLELEKQAFQRSRAEDEIAWREVTKREERRLQREKAILSRQSQVLLKLPSKRDKAEVEALSATLDEERRVGRAKDARHKLTVQRLQRHVTQLQGKVAELEDEVRWHAQHAANAPKLPSSNRQLHSASGVSQRPEQYQASKASQGTHLQNGLAGTADAKQHSTVDSSDCQQPRQALSSRPATPEHPEQQLCTPKAPRQKSSATAAGASGSDHAMPAIIKHASRTKSSGEHAGGNGAHISSPVSGSQQAVPNRDDTAVCAGGSEAGVLQTGGHGHDPCSVPARAGGGGGASEHRRCQGAKRSPSAVSWHIEVDRSRKPAPGHLAQAECQRISGNLPTLPMQPNSHDTGQDLIGSSPGEPPDVKHDGSMPDNTGPALSRHVRGQQSAYDRSQRPQARPLPPLPDFMSLDTSRSPSYSHDMPRMEALYAATNLASAFTYKPFPTAAAAKVHNSIDPQAATEACRDRQSISPRGAAQSPPVIQHIQRDGSAGAHAIWTDRDHEAHTSKQEGSAVQLTQAPPMCPDGLQQIMGAPLGTALHDAGSARLPGRAAPSLCSHQHCSTGAGQDGKGPKSWIFEGAVPPRVSSLDSAAGSSHDRAGLAGGPSGSIEPETVDHAPDFQTSCSTAASSDEYSVIKASLRTLQELLDDSRSPHLISNHTENTEQTGSSLDRANAGGAHGHGNERDAAATAQNQKQGESHNRIDRLPASRDAPEHLGIGYGSPTSSNAQKPGLHSGCVAGDVHQKVGGLPDKGHSPAVRHNDSDAGISSHQAQRDMSQPGTDSMDNCQAAPLSNGTVRHQCNDGRILVRFKNGDCKCSYADGTVEYYYAKADTWHTTCPDSIEVYHFPSGQTEAHHPGGLKEIIFYDGSVRLVSGKGAEWDANLDLLSDAVKRSRPDWETSPSLNL